MKKNYVVICNGICSQSAAAIIREIAKRRGSFIGAEAWPIRWTEWMGVRHAFSWNKIYAVHVTEDPKKLIEASCKAAKVHDDKHDGSDEANFWLADIRWTTEETFVKALKEAKTEKVEE